MQSRAWNRFSGHALDTKIAFSEQYLNLPNRKHHISLRIEVFHFHLYQTLMSFCSEQFLFLDPVDTNGLGPVLNQQRNVTSPKRTIQVNQARTPGGTLVTTTTMTTERPRDQKHEAPVDGRRVTYFYLCIASLDQNYIDRDCTG